MPKTLDLDRKVARSHSHVPAHVILKTRVMCRSRKTLYGVLPQLFLFHLFPTLVIMLFTIALIIFSVRLF